MVLRDDRGVVRPETLVELDAGLLEGWEAAILAAWQKTQDKVARVIIDEGSRQVQGQ